MVNGRFRGLLHRLIVDPPLRSERNPAAAAHRGEGSAHGFVIGATHDACIIEGHVETGRRDRLAHVHGQNVFLFPGA